MRDLGIPESSARSRLVGRVVAIVLLGLIGFCFVNETEQWPFSAFALFSDTRGPEQVTWTLNVVDQDGTVEPVDLTGLPDSLWGTHHVMPTLGEETVAKQRAAVEAWLQAAGYVPSELSGVQIVKTVSLVPTELDVESPVLSRTVTLEISLQ